jgi:hypothetical protein
MPQEINARLSDQISEPDLSLMWESERIAVNAGAGAPEIDIRARGADVTLRFPSGGKDPEHRKLKEAFERAVHRYRPEVNVDWAA